MNLEGAVKEYQCPGCVNGPYKECFIPSVDHQGCASHFPGTVLMGLSSVFLGLPKGFNRLGFSDKTKVSIFESYESAKSVWKYGWLNVVVWKHLDDNGNTIIRGLSPRINYSWIHVILGDCIDKFNCCEVTKEKMDEID